MTKPAKIVDPFETENREYLATGSTPEIRVRRACLRMCDSIRRVPEWRTIPALVSRLRSEQCGLASLRDLRRHGVRLL